MNKMVIPSRAGSGFVRQPHLRRGASGLPGAEGGRRELLRGELMQAAIYGLAGTEIAPEERDFFRDADPAASSCSAATARAATRCGG
jgi:hypothetical protein